MQHPQHLEGPLKVIGRYALFGELASGGMATVHLGRLLGPAGFSRTVAIKRLHPQFAKDPDFVAMFLDEARLAARIQHPNVVATVDVVSRDDELFLVMDYVRGESFSRLLKASRRQRIEVPARVISNVVAGMCYGLHAAHEAKDERGQPLSIVHRDVSPQNVIVGVDGTPRVLDFGVAKAAARVQVTRDGQMKGKLSYMSPEQLRGTGVDRRSDIYAAGIVLWEALTGRRLFESDDPKDILNMILKRPVPPPSSVAPVPGVFDIICGTALAKDPDERFQTARDFAVEIEDAVAIASPREVGDWVEQVAGALLSRREEMVAEIESVSSVSNVSHVSESSAQHRRPASRADVEALAAPSASAEWDDGPTSIFDPDDLPKQESTSVQVPKPVPRPPTPQASVADMDFDADSTTIFDPSAPAEEPPPPEPVSKGGRTRAKTVMAMRAAALPHIEHRAREAGDAGDAPGAPSVTAASGSSNRRIVIIGVAVAVAAFVAVFILGRRSAPVAAPEGEAISAPAPALAPAREPAAAEEAPKPAAVSAIDPSELPLDDQAPIDPSTLEAAEEEEQEEPVAASRAPKPSRAVVKPAPKPAPAAAMPAPKPAPAAAMPAPAPAPAKPAEQPPAPVASPSDFSSPYASKSAPTPKAAPKPTPAPAPASKPAGCADPFRIDENGIKRIKPECL